MGSIRFGSGLIVARLSDGSWSAPSAMATGGIGFGSQIGFELTDFVFVLNSDAAVKTFTQSGSLTLGRNVSVALGPYGRSGEVGGAVGSKGMVGMFAYSKTRGIFGGRSLEGGMMGERLEANKEMYGAELTARQLLSGKIPPPPEAEPLMRLLNSERFYTVSPISSSAELPSKNIHQQAAGLPAELAHEPPNGISELCAGEVSQVAELDAGPQHAIYEMPAGDDDTKVYELDASSPVSQPPKHDALSVKLDVPARSSKYDLLQKELPPLPLE